MRAGVADLVDLGDGARGVDEKRDAFGVGGVRLVGAALDAILATDPVIDVGEQREPEVLVGREGLVLGGGVERCADDRGAEGGEF
jgi:hypothetical protein